MSKELFDRVKKLNLPAGKYALFGSSPMCVRGLRECRDIDIIVTEDVWNRYRKKEGWEIRLLHNSSEYLFNDEIELYKDWKPGEWNVKELIRDSEPIDGLPFVRLEHVIEWKKLSAREKDLKDVELIMKSMKKKG